MPIEMTPERFDELVDEALDGIPDELASLVQNVVVLVEDHEPDDPGLLGLYDGVALTERGGTPVGLEMPDQIFIFRRPLLAMCADEAELVEEVRITVVHEVAHHFGINDERLHELGYA